MKIAAALVCTLLACGCPAQSRLPSRAEQITIGSASEDVSQVYGEPIGYFWHGRRWDIFPITDEQVYVVYRFFDAGKEYELRIAYASDNTQSRLHPTGRIISIMMISDKPISVSEGLTKMPGAPSFCANWCKVDRMIPGLELFITPSGSKRAFFAWTIEAYMNTPDGEAIPNAMRDLDSMATVFVLSIYDYTKLPLTRSVKGEWAPAL